MVIWYYANGLENDTSLYGLKSDINKLLLPFGNNQKYLP